MLKCVQIVLLITAMFMMANCMVEKTEKHKIIDAAIGCFLFVLLLTSIFVAGGIA